MRRISNVGMRTSGTEDVARQSTACADFTKLRETGGLHGVAGTRRFAGAEKWFHRFDDSASHDTSIIALKLDALVSLPVERFAPSDGKSLHLPRHAVRVNFEHSASGDFSQQLHAEALKPGEQSPQFALRRTVRSHFENVSGWALTKPIQGMAKEGWPIQPATQGPVRGCACNQHFGNCDQDAAFRNVVGRPDKTA